MTDGARAPLTVEIASGFGPAAVTGKLLADIGHHVVKIEPPEGDELRGRARAGARFDLWDLSCGSKDSLVADLERSGGREALDALLRAARVLIVDRAAFLRLGGRALARHPGLTVCVASSFGIDGPMAEWRGGEEIVQALSGIVSVTGHIGAKPVRIAGAMLTHATANLAAAAILADETAKRAGAPGSLLDACLFDTALAFQTAAIPAFFLAGKAPSGIGNRHTMAAPWNSFACGDGWIVVCAGNAPTWARLCEAIARPDLAADPAYVTQDDRVRNVDALEREVEAWTRARTIAEAETALDAAGIPSGRILPLETVLDHPQFAARALARHVGGRTIAGGAFFRDGAPLPVRAGAAAPGGATRAILRGRLDVPAAIYARWIDDGAVREAEAANAGAA
jgi:crotonobetainyl-CoA:carnitine CoA-transferase CaiB-like acyl-CoA transferase